MSIDIQPTGSAAKPVSAMRENRRSDLTPACRSSVVNALTIDVEDWFHANALSAAVPRSAWNDLPQGAERNTRHLLDILSAHDVRATFFVLGWVAERCPEMVRDIVARGHELACHGYSHKLVFEQSEGEFRAESIRAKTILEDVSGLPIKGYRASTYSITKRSLWALDVLLDLGFQYDSSIFPIRHDVYGLREAGRWPDYFGTPSGRRIIEFPISTLECMGFRLPIAGGGYFRLIPFSMTKFALRYINSRDAMPFVFYLHPWEIDQSQPRVSVGTLSSFRHYTNLHRTEARFEKLLRGFCFAPMRDVLQTLGFPVSGDTSAGSSR